MLKTSVVPWANLPAHMKQGKDKTASYLLIEDDGNLVDYFTDAGMPARLDELSLMIEWIEKAYKLGAGDTINKPSNKLCSYLAHLSAEEMRKGLTAFADDPFEKRKALEEARKMDEVSDRYAKGLTISEIRDTHDKLVAFKIKGESGFTYSLNPNGNTCTCTAGLTGSKICWHMRAIEIYREAMKTL